MGWRTMWTGWRPRSTGLREAILEESFSTVRTTVESAKTKNVEVSNIDKVWLSIV